MSPDPELVTLTLIAIVLFAGAAVLFPRFAEFVRQRQHVMPPPRAVVLIFRLWFAVLALASVALLLLSRHGLNLAHH